MTIIPMPHDALFKQFLTDPRIAKDFLQTYLPDKIKSLCDFNTLKLEPSSYVEKNLSQHFSDIVYSLKIAETDAYIYTLIEHLTTPKKLSAFTLLRYQIAIMKQHVDKGYNTLPVVVPLLFYRGKTSPYPFSTDIFDCFDDKALAEEVFLKPYSLIDITVIPDEELRTHRGMAILELIQKNIHKRDALEFIQDIALQVAKRLLTPELFNSLLYYISQEGESKHFEKFYSNLAEALPNYRENIMTLAQQLEQKGLLLGLQKGLEEGAHRKAIAIAKNLLAEGKSSGSVQKLTDLSEKEVMNLIEKH
jgi:predicted transposase/invertase (TIGR01784 family)